MLIIKVKNWVESLVKRQEGQGMVEYGLIIVGIAVAVGAVIALLGGRIGNFFNNIMP